MKTIRVTADMKSTAEAAAKWISPLWYYSLTKDLAVILAKGDCTIHFNGSKTKVYVAGIELKKRALVQLASDIRREYEVLFD